MARRSGKSGAGQILPRRRPLAARREDRMSALPDDLLLLILRRLDTRSALATGCLSRRWAHLPRELAALDLKAGDVLPPHYHRWVHLYNRLRTKVITVLHYRPGALTLELLPNIRRYERRAMRALTRSAESLLLEGPRRRVQRLSLEFFVAGNGDCMNRLVAEAIDALFVEDLEAVAKPMFRCRGQQVGTFPIHTFPSHGLCREPRASRLRSLKLGGCVPPPLHEYKMLTRLVLQGLQESTHAAVYEDIFTLCPQLQTLHLISCGCRRAKGMPLTDVAVDAPCSQIRELVVDDCTFRQLLLNVLPRLESLASLQSRVVFESCSFPCLRRRNLTMRLGVEGLEPSELELDMFLECTPDIRSLVIRFTGPYRWIVPSSSPSQLLPNLTRLLVADMPSSWDVTWPRLLLDMAPSLEILHIHIAPGNGRKEEPGEEIPWSPTELRQHHIKEFVVAGFKGTARQISLVKYVMGVCTELCRLAMFKNGHVQYKGHWDWEMVTQDQEQSWTDEEKPLLWKVASVPGRNPF